MIHSVAGYVTCILTHLCIALTCILFEWLHPAGPKFTDRRNVLDDLLPEHISRHRKHHLLSRANAVRVAQVMWCTGCQFTSRNCEVARHSISSPADARLARGEPYGKEVLADAAAFRHLQTSLVPTNEVKPHVRH
jgi:hypothetical protein